MHPCCSPADPIGSTPLSICNPLCSDDGLTAQTVNWAISRPLVGVIPVGHDQAGSGTVAPVVRMQAFREIARREPGHARMNASGRHEWGMGKHPTALGHRWAGWKLQDLRSQSGGGPGGRRQNEPAPVAMRFPRVTHYHAGPSITPSIQAFPGCSPGPAAGQSSTAGA
jgi:hypothetical protein